MKRFIVILFVAKLLSVHDTMNASSPLHRAVRNGNVKTVINLLDQGANINEPEPSTGEYHTPYGVHGHTPLQLAAYTGNHKMVTELLCYGYAIDVNLQSRGGFTALHTAAKHGHLSVVIELLYHPTLSARCTALDRIDMINEGTKSTARLFTADPNLQSTLGWTALHLAAERGYTAIVIELLRCGADVNLQDKANGYPAAGNAALHFAADKGRADIVSILLDHNAQVNLQNSYGLTALHYALGSNHTTIITNLLNHRDLDVNLQDGSGDAALHYAASDENTHFLAIILNKGATVNVQNNRGDTALHRAAFNGNGNAVIMLLEHGAHANLLNNDGNTALQVAEERNHANVVALLQEN